MPEIDILTPQTAAGIYARKSDVFFPESYGAKGDGLTNDSPAFAAMLADMPTGRGAVQLAARNYALASTFVLGDRRKCFGAGQNSNTTLKALTVGMTVMTYGSSSNISDLKIDGAGKTKTGLRATALSNKVAVTRVRVESCTDGGLVLEGTQNSLFLDCFGQYNLYDWKVLNGTANTEFINCNANGTNENAPQTNPLSRRILIANDTTDPDLTGTIYFGGNRALKFRGGIYERDEKGLYGVEVRDAIGPITLDRIEMNAGLDALLRIGPDVASDVLIDIDHATFTLSSYNRALLAKGGAVRWDSPQMTGLTGKAPLGTIRVDGGGISFPAVTTAVSALAVRDSNFQFGIGSWTNSGVGTVAWAASTGRVAVTSTGPTNGARCYFVRANAGAWGDFIKQYRHATVRMTLRNISRNAVELKFITATGFEPGGTFGRGSHEVTFELTGNEIGVLFASSVAGAAASFEIAEMKIEVR
jgi:hypothetical protein